MIMSYNNFFEKVGYNELLEFLEIIKDIEMWLKDVMKFCRVEIILKFFELCYFSIFKFSDFKVLLFLGLREVIVLYNLRFEFFLFRFRDRDEVFDRNVRNIGLVIDLLFLVIFNWLEFRYELMLGIIGFVYDLIILNIFFFIGRFGYINLR